MNIEITETTSLEYFQEEFNKIYPYLWISFFYPALADNNDDSHHHANRELINPGTPIKIPGGFRGTTIIDVSPETSVARLEQDLNKMVGLKTRVMRKSGSVWVATIFTGSWTLGNQNLQGEQTAIS